MLATRLHGVSVYQKRFSHLIFSHLIFSTISSLSFSGHVTMSTLGEVLVISSYILLNILLYQWFQWVYPHVIPMFLFGLSSLLNLVLLDHQGAAWQWALWLLCDDPTGTRNAGSVGPGVLHEASVVYQRGS